MDNAQKDGWTCRQMDRHTDEQIDKQTYGGTARQTDSKYKINNNDSKGSPVSRSFLEMA